MTDLFAASSTIHPSPAAAGRSFTTYRRHNCTRDHRSYYTFAKCVWRRADWVLGDGEWATVSTCRPRTLTVALHESREDARGSLDFIRSTGCGGMCRHEAAEAIGTHRLIRLVMD